MKAQDTFDEIWLLCENIERPMDPFARFHFECEGCHRALEILMKAGLARSYGAATLEDLLGWTGEGGGEIWQDWQREQQRKKGTGHAQV